MRPPGAGVRPLGWAAPAAPARQSRRPARRWPAPPTATAGVALGGGVQVSKVTIGTMQFGEGLVAGEAASILNAAAERGVTTFDTAEMYPVPQAAATWGDSERILGSWLAGRRREGVVVATKVAGPGGMPWLRGGPAVLDGNAVRAAVDASLGRLGTDYVDLLQLHWPDRYVPMFGEVDYDPTRAHTATPLEEVLGALSDVVRAGKARAAGLSNETPWGLCRCLHAADTDPSLARVVAIQNAYSLLCRTFDAGLAEVCHEGGVKLLAYSPLAMGLLTGKYMRGSGPLGARLNKYRGRYAEAEGRYAQTTPVRAAVAAYSGVAREAGMSPAALALRFVLSRPLVASAVTGVTGLGQLGELLDAAEEGPLPADVLAEIDRVHARWPNPTP